MRPQLINKHATSRVHQNVMVVNLELGFQQVKPLTKLTIHWKKGVNQIDLATFWLGKGLRILIRFTNCVWVWVSFFPSWIVM